MDSFMKFVIVLAFAFALGLLLTFPLMWVTNALFSAQFLTFVFGGPIGFWQAFYLSMFASMVFKSSGGSRD